MLIALEGYYIWERQELDWVGIGLFGLFVLAMFFCVILHELGHAFAARRYGVHTRDIIILPIGGVARLDRMPNKPMQELVIAVAGPLVNVAIALVIGGVLWLVYRSEINLFNRIYTKDYETESAVSSFFLLLGIANTYLVVFNMLPAFPLDGGRVLRALLSLRLNRKQATRIASWLGQAAAVVFFFYGLMNKEPTLTLISVFIFFAASSEYQNVRTIDMLSNFRVSELMRRDFVRIGLSEPVGLVWERMKHTTESYFLVFDEDGLLAGILEEPAVLRAVKRHELHHPVLQYYKKGFTAIHPADILGEIYEQKQSSGDGIFPVFEDDQLVGLLDEDMLDNFLRLEQKVQER